MTLLPLVLLFSTIKSLHKPIGDFLRSALLLISADDAPSPPSFAAHRLSTTYCAIGFCYLWSLSYSSLCRRVMKLQSYELTPRMAPSATPLSFAMPPPLGLEPLVSAGALEAEDEGKGKKGIEREIPDILHGDADDDNNNNNDDDDDDDDYKNNRTLGRRRRNRLATPSSSSRLLAISSPLSMPEAAVAERTRTGRVAGNLLRRRGRLFGGGNNEGGQGGGRRRRGGGGVLQPFYPMIEYTASLRVKK